MFNIYCTASAPFPFRLPSLPSAQCIRPPGREYHLGVIYTLLTGENQVRACVLFFLCGLECGSHQELNPEPLPLSLKIFQMNIAFFSLPLGRRGLEISSHCVINARLIYTLSGAGGNIAL